MLAKRLKRCRAIHYAIVAAVMADIPSAHIQKSVVAVPHECDALRASSVAAERGSDAPPSELLTYTGGAVQV